MRYQYKTKGTCASMIDVEIEGDIVKEVKFTGGCNGNLQAVSKLVYGRPVDEVLSCVEGISCNGKGTSCGDQLAKAIRQAYENAQADSE